MSLRQEFCFVFLGSGKNVLKSHSCMANFLSCSWWVRAYFACPEWLRTCWRPELYLALSVHPPPHSPPPPRVSQTPSAQTWSIQVVRWSTSFRPSAGCTCHFHSDKPVNVRLGCLFVLVCYYNFSSIALASLLSCLCKASTVEGSIVSFFWNQR